MNYQTFNAELIRAAMVMVHQRDYFKLAVFCEDTAAKVKPDGAWQKNLLKFSVWLRNYKNRDLDKTAFSVFVRGNSKLPFYSFSTLPGDLFCPGAGDCLEFCYSFKSHRYPAAFLRQCQNTILMQSKYGQSVIRDQMLAFASKDNYSDKTLRLYVDGDFMCIEDIYFWFEQLKTLPNIKAYGYSKSFSEFLAMPSDYVWPDNYKLNLSSGHNHSMDTVMRVKTLPIVRGEFIAVPVPDGEKKPEYGSREYRDIARESYHNKFATDLKPMVCPGKCGECTAIGHACGSDQFDNTPIIILAH